MGMYSWVCKGCGHELVQGETVRLNGSRQEYDGYGGSAGGDHDPSAWHNRCYLKASPEARLDESPSRHASNQGFGPAKLEFRPGYTEDAPVEYTVLVYAGEEVDVVKYHGGAVGKSYKQYDFHYTNNNKLEDQREYRTRYEKVGETIALTSEEWDAWDKLSKEDRDQAYADHQKKIEALAGGAMPERNEKVFASIGEAIAMTEMLLPSLPEGCNGEYQLIVYGRQGKIQGAVYEYDVSRKNGELHREETYRIGTPDGSNVKNRLALAISQYNEAEAKLKAASEALDRVVEPLMQTNEVDALHELVDSLPKKYRGVRRIYEKINRSTNW